MAKGPSAAQLRIIEAADPGTGRLSGPAATLAALVRLGLAFRHARPPHDTFLTPEGRRVRQAAGRLASSAGRTAGETPGTGSVSEAQAAPGTGSPDAVFAARTGDEPESDGNVESAGSAERARQVRSAWQGLIELRRMTHPHAATDLPCAWERAHLVRAAALALEAAGCRPAVAGSGGYRVVPTPQPEAVAVHAPTAAELQACAGALEGAGWQAGEHTDRRTAARFLLASPRRA
ncbi:hypothetical protein [Streptomyces sp. TS71-3]|uniref:hypothetical protein n=1 Tax=Streptomyces sp. TS71-3 TaxID=2733862 RepID=UPI001B21778E|nr:hypothetical protein [Streptomyces sp. TS71-3]GHJ41114.1 hypothetical protein Sm713_67230 [Streptomyces sp. TS71-3]